MTTSTSTDTSVAGTGVAPPASTVTVASGPTTTAAPTTTSAPAPTTTVVPLPVAGTGVRGQVTEGPTCPVERVDQPCSPRPVQARVAAIASDGHTAATAATDGSGRYALSLAPGAYTLDVITSGAFPRCPDTPITVASGSPQTVDISCDTGIR